MDKSHHNVISDDKIVLYGHYKKTLSVILSVILGISLIAFLFLYNLKITAANPEFYKTMLKNTNVYDRLINEGIPSLVSEATITQDAITNYMAQKAIIYIVKQSIPSTWVENQTNIIIDKVAKIFSEPKSTPNIVIDLDNMSTYLSQISDGIVLFEQIVPSCSATESENNTAKQLLGVSIDCKSMNINLDQIKDSLKKASVSVNELKKVNIDISKQVNESVESINTVKDYINNLSFYTWLSLIVLIISILLLLLLDISNLVSMVKYFAWPILVASVSSLIASLIMQSSILTNINNNLTFDLPVEMSSIISDFAKSSVIQYFLQVKIVSGILFVISLISIIIITIRTNKNVAVKQ